MADLALAYDADEHEDAHQDGRADDVVSLEDISAGGLNLAEHLTDQQRSAVVMACLDGYQRDKASREAWEEGFDKGMDLVKLAGSKKRPVPFNNAADVRLPLIATACIQFNARAYPAIVNGPLIVKAEVEGDDPDGQKSAIGERVAEHMSWQFLVDMPEWETDTDKLLLHLPAAGMAFRQFVWDPINNRPKSEFISAKRFVTNQETSDLETTTLFTVEFERYPYQIVEAQRAGKWSSVEVNFEDPDRRNQERLLRCHVRYDLDEDGYDEPYIAIIHKHSQALLSLTADFWPENVVRGEDGRLLKADRRLLIVPYSFIPDPEGAFYAMGFGQLLLDYNEAADALLNQMIDGTTLNNLGGGFVGQGVKLPGGVMEREPGEWKNINAGGSDLRAAMVPFPTVPVSPVTMQLLEFITQQARELTSTTAAVTGNAPANQPATTTLSNVEQSAMITTAVNKRVFRAVTAECAIVQALNRAFMPDEAEYSWAGSPKSVGRADYDSGDLGIKPVADPSMASAPQRMAQIQFLREFTTGNPLFDPEKVAERIMTLGRIPAWRELLAPPAPPGPNPVEAMKLEGAATELAEKHADIGKTNADVMATHAKAAGDLAQAESVALDNEAKRRALMEQDAGAAAGAGQAQALETFEAILDHPAPALDGGMGGMAQPSGDAPGATLSGAGVPPPQAGVVGGDMAGGNGSPAPTGLSPALGSLPGNSGINPGPTDGH